MKKTILPLAMLFALGLMAACTDPEIDIDRPTPGYEPPMYSYGVDVDFAGDTSYFVRSARFYFVTQTGADSVRLVGDEGDTIGIPNGVLNLQDPTSIHLRTTATAALFEGWLTFVIRDLPEPPATMQAAVTLSRNDTVYYTDTYSISTADTTQTIHLSSEM